MGFGGRKNAEGALGGAEPRQATVPRVARMLLVRVVGEGGVTYEVLDEPFPDVLVQHGVQLHAGLARPRADPHQAQPPLQLQGGRVHGPQGGPAHVPARLLKEEAGDLVEHDVPLLKGVVASRRDRPVEDACRGQRVADDRQVQHDVDDCAAHVKT